MSESERYPKKWTAFGMVILGMLLPLLLVGFFVKSPEDLMAGNVRTFIFLGEILIIIPPVIYAYRKEYNLRELFRWSQVPITALFWAFLAGLGISILVDEMDRLFSIFVSPPDWLTQSMDLFRITSFTDFLLLVGGVSVIAPIAEEIMFRGFLQTSLEYREQDATKAILITALAFAIIHMNSYWVVQIYLFGVALSYFSWRTQSIFPGMIVHMTINGFSILLTNLTFHDQMGWYQMGEHVSPVWLVFGAGAFYIGFKKINQLFPLDERRSQTILEKPEDNETSLYRQ